MKNNLITEDDNGVNGRFRWPLLCDIITKLFVSVTAMTKKLSHPCDSAWMVTVSLQNTCKRHVTPPFIGPLLALICKDAPNALVRHFRCDQDQSLSDFPFLLSATLPVAQSRLINFERSLVKCRPFFL